MKEAYGEAAMDGLLSTNRIWQQWNNCKKRRWRDGWCWKRGLEVKCKFYYLENSTLGSATASNSEERPTRALPHAGRLNATIVPITCSRDINLLKEILGNPGLKRVSEKKQKQRCDVTRGHGERFHKSYVERQLQQQRRRTSRQIEEKKRCDNENCVLLNP